MTTSQQQDAGAQTGQTPQRKMKVAVAGLGSGARQVVAAMENANFLELVAAADVRQEALDAFQSRFEGRTYDSVEKLCQDPEVEVIWVSTPNQFHCEHTITAAEHGKHVVVEKPMALNLDQARQMVEAAEKNNVKLLCGHTASLMAAYQAMRGIVRSGELGPLRAVNVWSYTDWIFRPRMPQELDLSLGGGVPYRQGPHQVDTVRLLGGGMVRSVRAMTGQWEPQRPVPGYYSAFIEFEDGTPATIVHNGYGYFSTYEFVPWAQTGRPLTDPTLVARRNAMRKGEYDDASEKNSVRFGTEQSSSGDGASSTGGGHTGFQGDLGIVIVSCQDGDIRQSPDGLWVYDNNGQRDVEVEGLHDERMAELYEMYQAIMQDRPVRHDGRWGMATLEVVLAIMQSGRERREIMMSHQSPGY